MEPDNAFHAPVRADSATYPKQPSIRVTQAAYRSLLDKWVFEQLRLIRQLTLHLGQ